MTPKEKAEELVQWYIRCFPMCTILECKDLAIRVADLLINKERTEMIVEHKKYWEDVKEEIECHSEKLVQNN